MISEMLWGTERVYYLHSEPHTIKKIWEDKYSEAKHSSHHIIKINCKKISLVSLQYFITRSTTS